MSERTAESLEASRIRREVKELHARIEATRGSGEGDPAFRPWLNKRLGELGPRLDSLETIVKTQARERAKAKKRTA